MSHRCCPVYAARLSITTESVPTIVLNLLNLVCSVLQVGGCLVAGIDDGVLAIEHPLSGQRPGHVVRKIWICLVELVPGKRQRQPVRWSDSFSFGHERRSQHWIDSAR